MILEAVNINTFYGSVQALYDVNFSIAANEITSVIGANGAGKSTLMKSVMGIVKPKSGHIAFNGKELTAMVPHHIVSAGIVYVPEGREIFPKLSVRVNLEMGAFGKKYSKQELNRKFEEMYALFPILKERQKQMADSLSGGEQQMLAIARGLMSDPKLIMFDEPSLGLAPVVVDELFDIIQNINKEKGIPIVLVEQNAYMALSISDTCHVLENGVVTMYGRSSDLMNDDKVRSAYLGG